MLKKSVKKNVKKQKSLNRKWLVCILIVLVLIIGVFVYNQYPGFSDRVEAYNESVSDYNILANEYINLLEKTSIDNLDGMPTTLTYKDNVDKNIITFFKNAFPLTGVKKLNTDRAVVEAETQDLAGYYMVAEQITNPTAEWLENRLKNISDITGTQAVTADNDPNKYLGAEGGYTACVYFTVESIDSSGINGADIVAKGVDAGGAIEVYETSTDALARCEYLSQFDNTLLYSGSYAIVGTMVVRTSYLLSNEGQVDLNNRITNEMTRIDI